MQYPLKELKNGIKITIGQAFLEFLFNIILAILSMMEIAWPTKFQGLFS